MFKRDKYDDEVSASELVERQLRGADYDMGVMEATEKEAENTKKAFSRLIQVLHDKGVLDESNVYFIAGVYRGEDDV